jgi:hypothetical protein
MDKLKEKLKKGVGEVSWRRLGWSVIGVVVLVVAACVGNPRKHRHLGRLGSRDGNRQDTRLLDGKRGTPI